MTQYNDIQHNNIQYKRDIQYNDTVMLSVGYAQCHLFMLSALYAACQKQALKAEPFMLNVVMPSVIVLKFIAPY